MSDATADVLDSAADLIEKHGWTRGDFGNELVGFCALGAMNRVVNELFRCENFIKQSGHWYTLRQAQIALDRHLVANGLASAGSIAAWNDRLAKSAQDVLDTLRAAAKEERG